MAKNRKQDRTRPKASVGASAPRESERSAMEPQPEHHAGPVAPADMARKGRQKRFGHN
ncbi:hypothetical protein [Streptomyces tropicalis]|uniref:Small hydrophilic protein n=1 Tax=Streptomyces tropicalis TaxID=3034234 RepID=A0ABT5ZXE9_9ACTN|nr:hypothetical protein [Streptomyces tropicalis]MDF3297074.1 hypothetical protein [Streptomyces tropicalis]